MIISPTDSSIAPARSSHAGRTLASGPGSSPGIRSETALWALGRSAGLPPELAIFSGEIDDAILHESALRAGTLGVGGEAVLIGQGHVSEEAYYERLAEALGVRLAAREEDFAVTLDWRAALRTGVAPLQGAAWLFAPRGEALRLLIERMPLPRHSHRAAIASPSGFRDLMNAASGAAMVREASQGLALVSPDLSAHDGSTRTQRVVLAILVGAFTVGTLFGGAIWSAVCAAFGVCAMVAVSLRLLAFWCGWSFKPKPMPLLPDADLPSYTILIALYREAAVAPRLVAALDALDYPAEKLDVLFAVEESDHETAAALVHQSSRLRRYIVRVPEGRPRTKPRALNFALAMAQGTFTVIFDAEDQPEPDQLRRAATVFAREDDRVACLQAALAIDNHRDGWLTRLFAIDYAGLFDVFNLGLARLGVPLPLGGTSNHFRTKVLRQVGGWDAWNVTEDADLGVRLARLGYSTKSLESTTWEEAPAGLKNWFAQRRRWMKGWMQTLLTHTRHPRQLVAELGPARAASVIALLAANTLGPLIGSAFMAYVLYDMAAGDLLAPRPFAHVLSDLFWIVLALSGLASIFLISFAGMTRRGLWRSAPYLLLRPVHMLLMTLAAWAALIELFHRPFHWAKTEHGLARSSLRSARAKEPS
ncbi:MAG: glycosyl transferase family 2 [Hyphomicrobiales bacterium]|nr:glycosyl transferase family 2 [Hyphomicrobiales bacterium]